MNRCECEHICHIDKDWLSPNGNPGHNYGQPFSPDFLTPVKTPLGTFKVCPDCRKDCYCVWAEAA